MTYDFHGSWESSTGHNAPLYSSNANDPFTSDQVTQFWISKVGANNKNKLLLGIPFYGQEWRLSGSNNAVGASGIGIGPMFYNAICAKIENSGWTRIFDTTSKTPYAFGEGSWVGYDDQQSIQEKINYMNANGLGGIFIWELSQDDYSKLIL